MIWNDDIMEKIKTENIDNIEAKKKVAETVAQKVKDGKYMVGNYITSFMGFLPADDPQVIVYIAIDNAKGATQYGGTIAAPIVKSILEDAIETLEIPRRKGWTEKKYNYLDKKYATIPDVVGKSTEDAVKALNKFKVEFTGTGNRVLYQSPKAKTRIYEGETVRLYLTE